MRPSIGIHHGRFLGRGCNFPLQNATPERKSKFFRGVLAQLVERLNGIEEVRGSNPLGSRPSLGAQRKRRSATPEKSVGGLCCCQFPTALQDYGLAGQPPMTRFVYVYILVSEVDASVHYTGIAADLAQRLSDHNRGHCRHTAKFKPWRIETAMAFASETKARAFEKYLKSGSGREFARRHF